MNVKRKKPRKLSSYNKQLLHFIEAYEAETNENGEDLRAVAFWAIQKGLWEPGITDVTKRLARELALACRQDYIADSNGEPVRRRHSYRDKDRQLTFWFKIEDATPQKMRISAQERRNGALMDILQIDRDLNYYNENHNPGDPIQMSFNFDPDVEERHLPTDYPDAPPDGA